MFVCVFDIVFAAWGRPYVCSYLSEPAHLPLLLLIHFAIYLFCLAYGIGDCMSLPQALVS